ncbi:hypothetical protein ABT56_06170 [Photobacterium aquae]|uniref:Alpha-acetolactate decarboxylase n=1 Tax=Photobacterium aquae TaxID=1195763 RepID=A0A0J1JXX0_9GAMM|nr:DUF2913 family protein [Photobacterium aquae]KLV07137.1 hypothetical protein ABT56_06170 [Photobacterium aquae]
MTAFYQEIYKVVSEGLQELAASQQSGKTPKNPISETHFISAWVTKAIKQQRYAHCVAKTLLSWQQQARSMGKHAQLKQQFEQFEKTYGGILQDNGEAEAVTMTKLQAFYQALEANGWIVTTEYEVNRKVTHHTDGQASLVVCATQAKAAFAENGELVKPLSLFIRGTVPEAIDAAYGEGILLYKVTDYKSIVKYHGEYVLYPHNAGSHLPEVPSLQ